MRKILFAFFVLALAMPKAHAQKEQPLRDSLKVAMQILSFHPDSIDLILKKASWNMQLEQWQYAKDAYDMVLRKEPANIAALFFRAYANEKLGRYKFSRLDYENLLTIVPGNFQAQLGLAMLNHKDKHYTEAMDILNRMASHFPDSAVVYAARANMEMEREMYELADYDLCKAIDIAPQSVEYRLSRAHARILLRRWEDAKDDLDNLCEMGLQKATLGNLYRMVKLRKTK